MVGRRLLLEKIMIKRFYCDILFIYVSSLVLYIFATVSVVAMVDQNKVSTGGARQCVLFIVFCSFIFVISQK